MQFKKFMMPAAMAGSLLAVLAMPAAAAEADESGFFVTPEVVYFTFSENNFDYATVGPYDADYLDGRAHRVDGDYELGYRLGLGYRWDNDWDFKARYTHVSGSANDSVQATGGDYLFLPLDAFDNYGYMEEGHAEAWTDQNLDYLDLTVGRTFTSENGHTARFFAGARWASFDQEFDVLYVDNNDEVPDPDDDAYSSFMDSDYTGYGVIVGAEGHLALGEKKEWSLFGTIGLGVLMGTTDQKRVDADWYYEDYPNLVDAYDIEIDVHDSFDSTSMVVEAQLGVEWARQFENVKFGIRWGFEIQHWSGIGTLQNYLGYDNNASRADGEGDVGLNGAFLSAGWAW